MTLPSADELLTGVSKNAHGSVDGIEDSENKKIDWRARPSRVDELPNS